MPIVQTTEEWSQNEKQTEKNRKAIQITIKKWKKWKEKQKNMKKKQKKRKQLRKK